MIQIQVDKKILGTCYANSLDLCEVITAAVSEFKQYKGSFLGKCDWDKTLILNSRLKDFSNKSIRLSTETENILHEIRGTFPVEIFTNNLIRGYLQANGYLPIGWKLDVYLIKEYLNHEGRRLTQDQIRTALTSKIEELGGVVPSAFNEPFCSRKSAGVACLCGTPIGVSANNLLKANVFPRCKSCAKTVVDSRLGKNSGKALRTRVIDRIKKIDGLIPDGFPELIDWHDSVPFNCKCGNSSFVSVRKLLYRQNASDNLQCHDCKFKVKPEIIRLRKSGMSPKTISENLEISLQYVWNTLQKSGIEFSPYAGKSLKPEIIRLKQSGERSYQIAQTLNVSRQYISRVLTEAGLSKTKQSFKSS